MKKLIFLIFLILGLGGLGAQPEFDDEVQDTPIAGWEIYLGAGGMLLGVLNAGKRGKVNK